MLTEQQDVTARKNQILIDLTEAQLSSHKIETTENLLYGTDISDLELIELLEELIELL